MMNPLDYPQQFQEVIVGESIYLSNPYSIHFTYPDVLNPVLNKFMQVHGAREVETSGGVTEASLRLYTDDCREEIQDHLIERQWPHTVEIIADGDVRSDWIRADFRWINGKYMSQVSDASCILVPYSDVLASFNNNTLDKLKQEMETIKVSLQEYSFSSEDIAQAKVQVLKELVHDNP